MAHTVTIFAHQFIQCRICGRQWWWCRFVLPHSRTYAAAYPVCVRVCVLDCELRSRNVILLVLYIVHIVYPMDIINVIFSVRQTISCTGRDCMNGMAHGMLGLVGGIYTWNIFIVMTFDSHEAYTHYMGWMQECIYLWGICQFRLCSGQIQLVLRVKKRGSSFVCASHVDRFLSASDVLSRKTRPLRTISLTLLWQYHLVTDATEMLR